MLQSEKSNNNDYKTGNCKSCTHELTDDKYYPRSYHPDTICYLFASNRSCNYWKKQSGTKWREMNLKTPDRLVMNI